MYGEPEQFRNHLPVDDANGTAVDVEPALDRWLELPVDAVVAEHTESTDRSDGPVGMALHDACPGGLREHGQIPLGTDAAVEDDQIVHSRSAGAPPS